MAALSSLKTGLRPVLFRVAIFYRLEACRLPLPEFLRPRPVRGQAVVALCYTQLQNLRSRFLPYPGSVSDHLAYRMAAEKTRPRAREDRRATWVLRRESSARYGTAWLAGLERNRRSKASFALVRAGCGISLSVTSRRGEEFFLRANRGPQSNGKDGSMLFESASDVRSFFEAAGEILPRESAAAPVDGMQESAHLGLEPLQVQEVRSSFFDDGQAFPEGAAVLDSAWCWVRECATPLAEEAREQSAAFRRGLDCKALPAL